ncbi:hypothetical protein DFH06DRAFT_971102 [Mycena polygramma]|nr:hypothetical protein DFH06DRAFT_971102 [Mycena polygramma]
MIVKGAFKSISIAIYGEIVSDSPPVLSAYEPKLVPSVDRRPLSRAVDPSSMLDPTRLATQLLSLIPDSPPLALVIRLMFCLKPGNDDWDLPEFPYLHADLDADMEEFDLETAVLCTAKPVRDGISYDALSAFATKVAESIGPKQQVELEAVFDAQTMGDEATLVRLLDAVANADIARHLNSGWFLAELDKIHARPTVTADAKLVARRLSARIRRWEAFEDALSNPGGDVQEAARMLEDVGLEEQSIGIWLETMLNYPNLAAKLAANPVSTAPLAPPLRGTTHDNLIAFTRAYVGVASVLAVWGWTDSLGNDDCRAQTLAIIVNHLLLLRQLTRRLEWITTDSIPPRKSGVLAEQILADLTKDPHAILRDDRSRSSVVLSRVVVEMNIFVCQTTGDTVA